MNNTFDRVILNNKEKPLSDDHNREWSQEDRTIRDVLRAMSLIHPASPAVASNGGVPMSPAFMGDAFFAEPNGGMVVRLRGGLGFLFNASDVPSNIDSVSGLDDRSPWKPLVLMADQTISIDAGVPGGQERIDIIEVKPFRRRTDANTRTVLDTGSGTGVPQSVLKNLAFALDGEVGQVVSPASSTAGISVKKGILQAVGTYGAPTYDQGVPLVTPGYVRIGQVYCGPAVAALTAGDLVDHRKLWAPYGQMTFSFRFTQADGTPDTITLTPNSALPPGVRLAVRPGGGPGVPPNIYIFLGDTGWPVATVGQTIAHASISASATSFLLGAPFVAPSWDYLDSADKADIAAQVAVGLGQKRIKWSPPFTAVASPGNTARTWYVTVHTRMS